VKLPLAFLTAFALVGCIGGAENQGPPGEPLLPGGYKAVLDAGTSDPGQFTVADTASVIRFTTGPAGIAWRPQDVIGPGDIRVEATMHLYRAPVAYRESYGIFVGGRNLDSPDQTYTYLMVRPTGDFTIRTRNGSATEALVEWMPHTAVQRVSQDGEEPVNTLVIQVRGPDLDFLINGTRVFSMDAAEADVQGVAGVRINHRLEVGLTAWSLGPPPPAPADSTSGI
jgi:hypothetical protein